MLNIPRREWECMPCGEFFDMIACFQIFHGAKQKAPEPDILDLLSYE